MEGMSLSSFLGSGAVYFELMVEYVDVDMDDDSI